LFPSVEKNAEVTLSTAISFRDVTQNVVFGPRSSGPTMISKLGAWGKTGRLSADAWNLNGLDLSVGHKKAAF